MFILKFVVLFIMDFFGIHFAVLKTLHQDYLSRLINFLASPYSFAPKVPALLHLILLLSLGTEAVVGGREVRSRGGVVRREGRHCGRGRKGHRRLP